MRRIAFMLGFALFALGLRVEADSYFTANLAGTNEVPSNASSGLGFGRATLNPAETQITVSMYYSGLSGTVTAAHIHAPAAAGANGPVVLNLNPSTGASSGSVIGSTFAVTPTFVAQLRSGLAYINVHTNFFPGGEIRGQLLLDAPLYADLSGRQEVPVVPTSARGVGVVSLNPVTNQVLVSLAFEGLSGAATAGHLHQAPAGTNGPVICGLTIPAQVSGTVVDALCALTAPQAAELLAGRVYLNLHTGTFPGGEIRGQIDGLMRDGFE